MASPGLISDGMKTDQDTFTMDVSELSPGLYYIQVINKGKSYGQKLMIKQ